jgi:hypothetical protein
MVTLTERTIMKSRSGVYSDTAENRRKHRVGQKYGAEKQPEDGEKTEKKEAEVSLKDRRTAVIKVRDKILAGELTLPDEERQKVFAELNKLDKQIKDEADKKAKEQREKRQAKAEARAEEKAKEKGVVAEHAWRKELDKEVSGALKDTHNDSPEFRESLYKLYQKYVKDGKNLSGKKMSLEEFLKDVPARFMDAGQAVRAQEYIEAKIKGQASQAKVKGSDKYDEMTEKGTKVNEDRQKRIADKKKDGFLPIGGGQVAKVDEVTKDGDLKITMYNGDDEWKDIAKKGSQVFEELKDSYNSKSEAEESYTRIKFDDVPNSGKINLKKYLSEKVRKGVDEKWSNIKNIPTENLKKMEKGLVNDLNKNFEAIKKSQRAELLYSIMKVKGELASRGKETQKKE